MKLNNIYLKINNKAYRKKTLHFIYFYKKRMRKLIDLKLSGAKKYDIDRYETLCQESFSALLHQLYLNGRYGFHERLVKYRRKIIK